MNFGVLGSVKSLEVSRFVDWDVSVDCHEDDDVDRAGHEGVDQWQFEMCLIEGDAIGIGVKAAGDVVESGDGSDEHTQVWHRKSKQVHVHHTCIINFFLNFPQEHNLQSIKNLTVSTLKCEIHFLRQTI